MSAAFNFKDVPTIREYMQAMVAYTLRLASTRNTLMVYFLVCGMVIFNLFRSPSFEIPGLLILFLLLGVGYYVLLRLYLSIKQLHQSLVNDDNYFLKIDPEGVHTKRAAKELFESWDQYEYYFEAKSVFVFVLTGGENNLLVVPKRFFTEQTVLQDFRKLIKESLPNKSEKDQQDRRQRIIKRHK